MDKKKKIIIIAIISVVAIAIIVALGIAIFENNKDGSNNKEVDTQPETTQYAWPDLTKYDIPNLEKGVITDLVDECNKKGYELNYVIDVNNLKKSDIDDYTKKFDSNWVVSENEDIVLIISSYGITKYSIFINVDEENEKAKFTISSLSSIK